MGSRMWLASGAAAVALTLAATVARADPPTEFFRDSSQLAPGASATLSFTVDEPEAITAVMAPDIAVAFIGKTDCDLLRSPQGNFDDQFKAARHLAEGATGSVSVNLEAGDYCVVVANQGAETKSVGLVLSAASTTQHTGLDKVQDREAAMIRQGNYAEAEVYLHTLYDLMKSHPDVPVGPIIFLNMLGPIYLAEGKWNQAEDTWREAVDRSRQPGIPEEWKTTSRGGLEEVLAVEGRGAELRETIRAAWPEGTPSVGVRMIGPYDMGALDLQFLVDVDAQEGRSAEAEAGIRRLLQPDLHKTGDQIAMLRLDLARAASAQGRLSEAEADYKEAIPLLSNFGEGQLSNLSEAYAEEAGVLERENRIPLAELAARLAIAVNNSSTMFPAGATEIPALLQAADYPAFMELSRLLRLEGDAAEAAVVGREGCKALREGGKAPSPGDTTVAENQASIQTTCDREAALTLWALAADGPGKPTALASGTSPATDDLKTWNLTDAGLKLDALAAGPIDRRALAAEAFEDAQRADQSTAGEALSRASALSAAKAAGAGDLADQYEAALAARANLRKAAGGAASAGPGHALPPVDPAAASARFQEVNQKVADLAGQLQSRYPLYWDYRSPSPLGVSALMATSGADAALLKANEAVVLWMVAPGADHGLVFAVSKTGVAWARMGMSGAEIATVVKALRRQLDPQAMGAVSGADLAAAGSGGMAEGGASGTPAAAPAPAGFDRAAAFRLYQALLGDPQIQKVLHQPGIDTLLIVPSGPLTSLPPAVLTTGKPGDAAAHWLIEDYALTVLPQVSALRTLRQLLPASRSAAPTRPLLAFADPDFAGVGAVPGVFPGRDPYVLASGQTTTGADRGAPSASTAERDGRSRAEILSQLPPLWDTRAEGVELMTLLGAGHADLLLGPAATKTALMERQADHSLVSVKVLDFSTHGLITGDFAGLTEPALVLAAPPAGTDPTKDDQLLRASEAAGLTLNADWVVLSACNTAAGETPGADGLSGLARAFFHAGAKSLLVSHWRVQSDATERLITTTFKGYQSGAPSKAKALQAAMIAMIKDPAAANPSLWAPFVIVGEPQ